MCICLLVLQSVNVDYIAKSLGVSRNLLFSDTCLLNATNGIFCSGMSLSLKRLAHYCTSMGNSFLFYFFPFFSIFFHFFPITMIHFGALHYVYLVKRLHRVQHEMVLLHVTILNLGWLEQGTLHSILFLVSLMRLCCYGAACCWKPRWSDNTLHPSFLPSSFHFPQSISRFSFILPLLRECEVDSLNPLIRRHSRST